MVEKAKAGAEKKSEAILLESERNIKVLKENAISKIDEAVDRVVTQILG